MGSFWKLAAFFRKLLVRRRECAAYFLLLLLLLPLSKATAQILPADAVAERLTTGFNFTEGPLDDGTGGILFTNLVFNNLDGSDIVRYDIQGKTTQVLVPNSGGANGLFRDLDGKVISMDGATRQISRRSPSNLNTIESILASQFNGARFNSPNDLVIDSLGGIYFTDPDYNNNRSQPESVYYIDPQGGLTRLLTGFASAARPNGIALSPDEQTLYLAIEGEKRILSYEVIAPGSVQNETMFALTNVDGNGTPLPGVTNGPDGMTVDSMGNIYAAVQDAVFAWDPSGQRLFDLAAPENPTNVTFGSDAQTLYITARTSLYSVKLNLPGVGSADFDEDVDVDGSDFLSWQRGFGILSSATLSQGDADGNHEVNNADLAIWQTQVGLASAGAGATLVPESSSTILLCLAVGLGVPDPVRSKSRRTAVFKSGAISRPLPAETL